MEPVYGADVARTLSPKRAILTGVAALLILLAGAPSASAATGRGFFGVLPAPESVTAQEFARMSRGGVGFCRVSLSLIQVSPQPGVRNWQGFDQVVTDAARADVTIFPTLIGVPSWVALKPAKMPIDSPGQRRAWSSFVTEAVDRYGPGGQFWAEHPELPYKPITDWQAGNEPNIPDFVAEKANPRRYAAFVRLTHDAMKAGDPGARLVLAGLFRRPRTGIEMTKFLDGLYRVRGIKNEFEAVSVHPYAKRPRDVLDILRRARRVMKRRRDAGTPLWVTEVGWTTGGAGLALSPYQATLGQQAAKLSATYRLLIRRQGKLRLERVFWHTFRDFSAGADLWTNYMGLFTTGGAPKPAWFAFTQVTGGLP